MSDQTWPELVMALGVGLTRFTASRVANRTVNHGAAHHTLWARLLDELTGAPGELVVAKELGLYWPGAVETFQSEPDVPGWGDVRATRNPRGGLILHPEDPDERPVALVLGEPGAQRVTHYAPSAGPGKQDRWWRADWPAPAWCVPQEFLRVWGT